MKHITGKIIAILVCVLSFNVNAGNTPKYPKGFKPTNSIRFTENKGQIKGYDALSHPEVKYVVTQGSAQVFLLEKGLTYQFTQTHFPKGYKELMSKKESTKDFEKQQQLQKQIRTEAFRMDMTLAGANTNAKITAEGRSIDYINFYNHNVLDVHSYNKITYTDIYKGIDWIIYTNEKTIKYDFVVHPGADPSQIKMQFKHQEGLVLNKDGSFTLKNSLGEITEKAPLSFQNNSEVPTKFVLENNCISFNLGNYNKNQLLIIDPSLVWATYYGGSDQEDGLSCSTDAFGNVYLGGWAISTANIASGGYQNIHGGGLIDAFLVKFDNSGVRQWSTYYGSLGDDRAETCATDALGNVYLGGWTSSTVGIASGGHQNTYGGGDYDAFLVKFNSLGVRQWATYYGNTDYDVSYTCATDISGNVYLAGSAASTASIASGGHQSTYGGGGFDAYLVKFNSAGVRQWATYYGGSAGDGASGCATDASGNVFLAGGTGSSANIASGGHQNTFGGGLGDGFLVKFNSAGVRQWATYYGGANNDDGYGGCATDASGNVYLGGHTSSAGNIAFGGHQNTFGGGTVDGFLAKFNSAGVRQWATYYGGNAGAAGNSCATDASGNVYLAGNTLSSSNMASGGYQNTFGGSMDAFLVKFSSTGVRQWATYYGSSGFEVGSSCATDASGQVYLSGATTSSINIGLGGYQNSYGGNEDAFLVKFCNGSELPSAIGGNSVVCSGVPQIYSITNAFSANSYTWSLPGSWTGSSSSNSISVLVAAAGVVSVSASNACGVSLVQTLSVSLSPSPTISVNSGSICSGQTFSLIASGALTYSYSSGSNLVSPSTNTSYAVTGTNSVGCISSNTAIATISVAPLPTLSVNSGTICSGQTFTIIPTGASTYSYSGGSNLVSPVTNTTYAITGTSSVGCSSSNTAIASVSVAPLPTLSVNSGSICNGQTFTIIPAGASVYVYSGGSNLVSPTTNTSYTVSGTSSVGCASTNTVISSVSVSPLPTISVNSGSICSGNSFTINPDGANTYTFSGGSHLVSPTTNTTYAVTGTSSVGCVSSNTAIASVSVSPSPTLSVNSGSICSGSTFTILPTGALTYVYSGGSHLVSPTTNATYAVSGTSSVGCASTNTVIASVTVSPLPTISVNSGSICSGQTFTLTASGASTYSYPGGFNLVSPTTNTTYAVTGTSSLGCISSNTAIASVSVIPVPVVSVNSGSICAGNSFTILPSGAATYTISGGSATVSPASTSSYSVTGTSSLGCITTNAVLSTVTVYSLPILSAYSTNSIICAGETVTLTVSGANQYTWTTGDNSNFIVISPAANTSYTVTGTTLNGCSKTSVVSQSVDICSGINSLHENNPQWLVYPNPNNGEFFIESSHETTIIVINTLGQIILPQCLSEGKNKIDLREQPNGVYFIRTNDITKTIKVIKQ